MNDMSATAAKEGSGRIVERGIERHLRLDSGDTVHYESILALEFLYLRGELGVEAIVGKPFGRQTVDASQTFAQPAYPRIAGADGERLGTAGGGPPQQHVIAEPAARQIADADFALRAAQVHSGVLVVEPGKHQLMRAPRGVDDIENGGPIEQPQLRKRTALRQALEPGLERLAARIDAAGERSGFPRERTTC
jgi:hypothetical protein